MQTFTITYSQSDTGTNKIVKADFEDAEVLKLRAFLKYTRDLETFSIVSSNNFGAMTIRQQDGQPPTFHVTLPSMEAIAALLHKLRRFMLNEPTSFEHISGILNRRLRDPWIHQYIAKQRTYYEKAGHQDLFSVTVNGVIMNSEATMDKWLNATGEYHEDPANKPRRIELDKINEVIPSEATKFCMLSVLKDRVSAIFAIANIVALLLGEE